MTSITTVPIRFLRFFIAFLGMISGCAVSPPAVNGNNGACQELSAKVSNDLSTYSLFISSGGDLYDVNKNPVADPNAHLEKIFENFNRAINSDSRVQLTVFIHGGLNTSKHVSRRVEHLWKPMLEDCRYPLFISWRSEMLGNYSDHLLFLRHGEYSSTGESGSVFDGFSSFIKGPLVSPFVLTEDVLRAASRYPATTYQILIDQNVVKQRLFDDNSVGANTSHQQKLGNITLNLPPADENEELDFRDVWSLANPVKLVTAPLVDSIGSGAWNSMLRRTDLVLANEKAIPINQIKPEVFPREINQQECKAKVDENRTAVSEFFRIWQCRYRNRDLNLIGHSMGSIIGNKIIAKYPEINFSQIVYMAAACTLNNLENVISPYLNYHPRTTFYNLSLHPLRDQFENASQLDLVPRGSLLWWIDSTLGTINSFQDRTAGYWPNIYKVAPKIFPKKIQSQVHLTKFGMGPDSPQTHGSFGDFMFWRESFWEGKVY